MCSFSHLVNSMDTLNSLETELKFFRIIIKELVMKCIINVRFLNYPFSFKFKMFDNSTHNLMFFLTDKIKRNINVSTRTLSLPTTTMIKNKSSELFYLPYISLGRELI